MLEQTLHCLTHCKQQQILSTSETAVSSYNRAKNGKQMSRRTRLCHSDCVSVEVPLVEDHHCRPGIIERGITVGYTVWGEAGGCLVIHNNGVARRGVGGRRRLGLRPRPRSAQTPPERGLGEVPQFPTYTIQSRQQVWSAARPHRWLD